MSEPADVTMPLSEGRPRRARGAVLLVFLVNGALTATWASRIPAIKHALGLNQAELGVALLGGAIGALIAMNVSGYFAARLGSRPVTIVTTLALCGVFPLLALAPNLPLLFGALFLVGACIGSMDVAMNAQGVTVENLYGRPVLAGFHGMYSLGGLLGALAGGLAASLGIDPVGNFVSASIVSVCIALFASAWLLPAHADAGGGAIQLALPSPALLSVGLVALCTVVGEGAMTDWTAVYLRDTVGTSAGVATLGFAMFSLVMAAGRFAGDRLNLRWGPVSMVRWGTLISAAGVSLAIALPSAITAIVGFGLAGAGFAAIFPIAISTAGRSHDMPSGTAIAAVSTCGYFGFLVGPPAIGFVSQAGGLRLGLGVVVLLCLLASALAPSVAPGRFTPKSSAGTA